MPVRVSEAHSGASLEEEAAELLQGVRDVGSEIDLSQMWTRVYGIMEKKSFNNMVLMLVNMQAGRLTLRWWR